MNNLQYYGIGLFACVAIFSSYQGWVNSKKKNTNGLTPQYFFMGSFVWADAAILGLFWFLLCVITLIQKDWWLFLFSTSVFWVIRSLGEVMYWPGRSDVLAASAIFFCDKSSA
jgi:hypothetical protein